MSVKMIDWETIGPTQFEFLCSFILEANGFTQIQWYGKAGSDKGRDLVAKKVDEPIPGHTRQTTWIVQCKRLIKNQLRKGDVSDFLNSCREHDPDNVLLIVTKTLSSNMKDWITSIKKDYKFLIFIWEERDIYREIVRHKDFISKNWPSYNTIPAEAREVIIYERSPAEIRIACNEFEDVELAVLNCSSYEEARKKAEMFLEFIRTHKLRF